MKTRKISILTFLLILFFIGNNKAQSDSIDYLGQKAPGYYPEKFAPGVFMNNEWGPVFSPDGNELFYTWQNPNGNQDYHINYMKKPMVFGQNPYQQHLQTKTESLRLNRISLPTGKDSTSTRNVLAVMEELIFGM